MEYHVSMVMRTRSQDVTETLRDWILTGAVSGGERLEEIPVAAKLGVSRTPVRAALAVLEKEGLVDYQPKRGYAVRAFEMEQIFAAYQARGALEGTRLPASGRERRAGRHSRKTPLLRRGGRSDPLEGFASPR